jgi:hypothetical protein
VTHYGLNPSFVFNSPLPLFRNLLRRAKRDGPELRLFNEQAPALEHLTAVGAALTRSAGGALMAKLLPGAPGVVTLGSTYSHEFDPSSLVALASLRPKVLRTLDWQMTNHRPDWTRPRVMRSDFLQGTEHGMAVELQAQAANFLGCHLWWCAPPRFELSVAEYELRLELYLTAIKNTAKLPPILEYGNELWNAGFAVHNWLADTASGLNRTAPDGRGVSWHTVAANEIATLKRVADRVFGVPVLGKSYYLFVGGQLTVPSHLDKILGHLTDLGVRPDLAGPALYVTPMKAQKAEWEATGAVPTQEELKQSCFARLVELAAENGPLHAHYDTVARHGVPNFACYEAGQSLIAGAHPWRKAALEAQGTEWMGELYRRIRATAEAAGVDLLCWYSAATNQAPNDSRVDVFGLLGAPGETVPPKALAARGD